MLFDWFWLVIVWFGSLLVGYVVDCVFVAFCLGGFGGGFVIAIVVCLACLRLGGLSFVMLWCLCVLVRSVVCCIASCFLLFGAGVFGYCCCLCWCLVFWCGFVVGLWWVVEFVLFVLFWLGGCWLGLSV